VEVPEDGCWDVSRFSFVPEYLEALFLCWIQCAEEVTLQGEIPTLGPVTVWVNHTVVLERNAPFGYIQPEWVPVTLRLKTGNNSIAIRGQMIGWRESRMVFGLRFLTPYPTLQVGLPVEPGRESSWIEDLKLLQQIQIRQFCFPEGKLRIYLPQKAQGNNLQVTLIPLQEETKKKDANSPPLYEKVLILNKQPHSSPISPEVNPFQVHEIELTHSEPLLVKVQCEGFATPYICRKVYLPSSVYSTEPYGRYQLRKEEALASLSRREEDIMGALCGLAKGTRKALGEHALTKALDFLNERRDCADFYALALLVALYKFGKSGRLLETEKEAIEDALLRFKYWHTEPGVDAMCWFTENHQIIFHASGYLAGSLLADKKFMNSGLLGRELALQCERQIREWILPRLKGGYSEWDSNTYLAMDIYALLALVEYGPSVQISKLARNLLDKTFFMIACQSLRGAHGCSHGRCYTEGLKTARVESTAGLQRIAWGMGSWEGESWATGMLALSDSYEVHPLVQTIGSDLPPLLETRARSYGSYTLSRDLREGTWEVNTFTRRTPHYLLSSALDHRPGEAGIQEHLWQLTFSPEAVLFSTWPGNSQEHGNARPNYWAGSAQLPRVAQEGRQLLCLYHPTSKAGLGFGHAYCPREVFDEVVEQGEWIFVRWNKGYGALHSDGKLQWIKQGPHAFQELRSSGGGRTWIACAGSEEEDGDFRSFQEHWKASQLQIQSGGVVWRTARSQELQFSWQGPLRVNGKKKELRFLHHYENMYTTTPLEAKVMSLQREGQTLTLDLEL
ncbi:MAG: hypothetical protein SNJ78_05485, partial [Spirochaetales bacterium]